MGPTRTVDGEEVYQFTHDTGDSLWLTAREQYVLGAAVGVRANTALVENFVKNRAPTFLYLSLARRTSKT